MGRDRNQQGAVVVSGTLKAVVYPLMWRVRVVRPEWFGRTCRIVVHGGRRGARLVEFSDGERVVCPGAYLRRHRG